ncbi:stage II sporulation protein M [Kallotenue papyrolyticum]|uniref:stage II sporulation protein M n=1 Tax=Kallotenue papyrolyticum TaxID=1325125 RepID=UPI0004785930|nr:stage II sporulation protein M [Kallotenue papyrolyticum]
MFADEFIQRKRADWERLEALLARAQSARLQHMSAADVYELGRLYRQATSDLAVARRDFPQHRVTLFLNNLVARAHAAIYRDDSTSWQRIRHFVLETYPRTWRTMLPFTLAAWALFLVPALIAFVVALRDPTQAELLFPGAEALAEAIRQREEWWQSINTWRSGSAALIAGNNILVTLQAFAGGMLFGLLTIYAMIVNGLMLGVVAGLSAHYGFSERLWGFVAAHAAIELSVIWFAGGAGLSLPWAILRPGLLTRGAALRQAAQRAGIMILGCIPLLLIAGSIEAFISPSNLPVWLKYGVSLASGVALYSYLWGVGRDPKPPSTTP